MEFMTVLFDGLFYFSVDMQIADLKYLSAFIIPLLVYIGINAGGYFTISAFFFAFVCIPLCEPLFETSTINLNKNERTQKSNLLFFDLLLFLNVPILYGLIFFLNSKLRVDSFNTLECIGIVLSLGTALGACGINVAHELGHKSPTHYKIAAILLLIPNHYTHFIIEHNRGHHKYVATSEDPATARLGETIYAFWIRSVLFSYLHAWQLEKQRLNKLGLSFLNIKNQMIQLSLIQLVYLIMMIMLLSTFALIIVLLAGVIGFLLLETINYIEHYGLTRKKLPNGRYERVQPKHSWNSNHQLGRIVLYELTRHSDHHFLANKKYQLLDHHDQSPQLPFGYPTAMLASLIPPLWFRIINSRIPPKD